MLKYIHPVTKQVYWYEPKFGDWFKERDGLYLDPCREPAGVDLVSAVTHEC